MLSTYSGHVYRFLAASCVCGLQVLLFTAICYIMMLSSISNVFLMTSLTTEPSSTKPTQKRRQSSLLAYRKELVALKKRGYSYQSMANFLSVAYHHPVSRNTVFDFMKNEGLS